MAGRHHSFDAQTRMVEDLAAALRHGQDALGEGVLLADQAARRILAAAGVVEVASVPLDVAGTEIVLTLARCAPAQPAAGGAPEPVTGLPGRPFLLERVAGALASGAWVGLLCVGLDRVGLVNDALGHAAGDELLATAGRRLQAAVRAGDVVARLSGDEFAILCEDLDGPALDALAGRLRTELAAPLVLGGTELYPSAVVGITAGSGPRRDPDRLLREATAAMHGAKLAGRAVGHHQPGTRDGAERALRTEAELHHALDRGELVLHYQPQIDFAAGRAVRGVEALVRWQHPERGLIGPDAFIATAEDTGLIRRLGAWGSTRRARSSPPGAPPGWRTT